MLTRILVVDDSMDAAEMIRIMITSCYPQYQIDTAYSGEQCLEMYANAKYSEKPYHLIILDLAMPYMNGFEVEAKIWNAGDTETRIAFLSAHGDTLSASRDSYTRVVGIWTKPIERNELCELVEAALNCQLPTDMTKWKLPGTSERITPRERQRAVRQFVEQEARRLDAPPDAPSGA